MEGVGGALQGGEGLSEGRNETNDVYEVFPAETRVASLDIR